MRRRDLTPAWVLTRLENQGLPRGHVSRVKVRRHVGSAIPRWCECGLPIYVGYAGGLPVSVDPSPTTVLGEGFAIIDGRWTVRLWPDLTMTRRRAVDIALSDADDEWVLIEHRCGGPLPLVNDRWAPTPTLNNDPPF